MSEDEKRMSISSDGNHRYERIGKTWGTPPGIGERINLAPDFWLERCSRNVNKFCQIHVFKADTEGSPALLDAKSV